MSDEARSDEKWADHPEGVERDVYGERGIDAPGVDAQQRRHEPEEDERSERQEQAVSESEQHGRRDDRGSDAVGARSPALRRRCVTGADPNAWVANS